MTNRRKFTPEFKARVVLEMITTQKSAAQVSREYGIKDSVLSRWKQEFIERSPKMTLHYARLVDADLLTAHQKHGPVDSFLRG